MVFKIICAILFFSLYLENAFSCEKWFKSLNIKDPKSCVSKCTIAETDMSSYLCPNQCDRLCKHLSKPQKDEANAYDLTDDEIAFCNKNPIVCAKAYRLSWSAEE